MSGRGKRRRARRTSAVDRADRAVAEVSVTVRRLEREQHRTAERLNRRMRQILRESPDVNDWPAERIAAMYPDLVKLMEAAARAQVRLVKATRSAAHKLQLTAGLALPAIRTLQPLDELSAVCEGCGCTYFNPCEGGCSWDPEHWARGSAICSRCAPTAPLPL